MANGSRPIFLSLFSFSNLCSISSFSSPVNSLFLQTCNSVQSNYRIAGFYFQLVKLYAVWFDRSCNCAYIADLKLQSQAHNVLLSDLHDFVFHGAGGNLYFNYVPDLLVQQRLANR